MSTLFDALKKAEKTQQAQNPPQFKALGKRKGDIPVVVVILLAVILVFAIFRAVSMFRADALAKKKSAVQVISFKEAAATRSIPATPDTPSAASQQPVVKKTYVGHELEGVICNGDSCVAVINGKLLKPQDTIDNYLVVDITPRSAELRDSKDNSTTVLQLK